jgi:hypothetical protein
MAILGVGGVKRTVMLRIIMTVTLRIIMIGRQR